MSESLMDPGKARWLLEGGSAQLSDGERALLLALARLEEEMGRPVTPEERAALEKLAAEAHAFDPAEIAQAVDWMVSAKSQKERQLDWSELRKRWKR